MSRARTGRVRSSHPGPAQSGWPRRYQAMLVAGDVVGGTIAAVIAYFVRFGGSTDSVIYVDLLFGALLPLAWVGVIAYNRGYEARFVGVGSVEFDRLLKSFLYLTVATVFISYLTKAPVARGFVVMAVPLAFALALVSRYAARKWLHAKRARGEYLTSVLALGTPASVADFAASLHRDAYAGMTVVGACLPGTERSAGPDDATSPAELDALGIPVVGDVDSVAASAAACGAHSVAVVSREMTPDRLRWISWQLEGTKTALIVSPGLTEVGGRRLHIHPVAGLPLLHVDEPEFTGFRRVLKGAFDRSVALAALVLLSPVFLAVGLAVRLTSKGPALFRQVRVGVRGSTFVVYKFRSMCVDAEVKLFELRDRNENADGLLFKIKDDPRITRVGKFIRRYSLDELPQLINVIKGDMSLVGPRPPLPTEVAGYGADVRRRLLVKPGITGLWQVSGRSDLSWEESVRLDLRYVENWTLSLDLLVLWKTARAVLKSDGAY